MFPTLFLTVAGGILLPFLGTILGAATVYTVRQQFFSLAKVFLYGFAAGVMLAASVWSLLLPALESSDSPFPVIAGFISAILFFSLTDWISSQKNTQFSCVGKKMAFAVTLHNVPEGMAVGVIFAAALQEDGLVSLASAMLLSLGIAIQNFPEGAVISLPLHADGVGKKRSFLCGALSGSVEPCGALLALLFTGLVHPILPFLLSFAAGAMVFVVAEEIIPEIHREASFPCGTISLGLGFCVMMALDVIFG